MGKVISTEERIIRVDREGDILAHIMIDIRFGKQDEDTKTKTIVTKDYDVYGYDAKNNTCISIVQRKDRRDQAQEKEYSISYDEFLGLKAQMLSDPNIQIPEGLNDLEVDDYLLVIYLMNNLVVDPIYFSGDKWQILTSEPTILSQEL